MKNLLKELKIKREHCNLINDPKIITAWEYIKEFSIQRKGSNFTIDIYKDGKEIRLTGIKMKFQDKMKIVITMDDLVVNLNITKELIKAKKNIIMIANAAHELRTPLGGVINGIELMEEELNELEDESKSTLTMILKRLRQCNEISLCSSKHLLSTINDILVCH